MDTDAQPSTLPERDSSPAPDQGAEQGSRFGCFSWRRKRPASVSGEGPAAESGESREESREEAAARPLLRRGPVLLMLACLAFVGLLSAFVVQPFLIPSSSMENTLQVGDRVLVNKLAYRFGGEPRRGDAVVFDGTGSFVQEEPAGNPVTELLRGAGAAVGLVPPAETDYIKRVIGVGGDRVTCCDKRGRIKVNGEPVDELYLHPGDSPSDVPFDVVVPKGKLWVMGDHRARSSDSRDHLGDPGGGTVPLDKVIGRADWIGWPVGRWTSLERPRAFDGIPAPAGPHG
ncbi:signal peptidase I [Streptomyces ochraceiscleroticus]|uniref:Signal peptidase I n=1 Tax=Streptomyces ochraceiscleroticus TaxID=47761 RepID=A0ABW1MDG6_9ACTN|nr:signal peptidase I [Streptomyces ochraceiscleroticus]